MALVPLCDLADEDATAYRLPFPEDAACLAEDVQCTVVVPMRVFTATDAEVPAPTAKSVLARYAATESTSETTRAEAVEQVYLTDLECIACDDDLALYACFEIHRHRAITRVAHGHFERTGTVLYYESRTDGRVPLLSLLRGQVTSVGALPSLCTTFKSAYCTCRPPRHLPHAKSTFSGRWTECDSCGLCCHDECLNRMSMCARCA